MLTQAHINELEDDDHLDPLLNAQKPDVAHSKGRLRGPRELPTRAELAAQQTTQRDPIQFEAIEQYLTQRISDTPLPRVNLLRRPGGSSGGVREGSTPTPTRGGPRVALLSPPGRESIKRRTRAKTCALRTCSRHRRPIDEKNQQLHQEIAVELGAFSPRHHDGDVDLLGEALDHPYRPPYLHPDNRWLRRQQHHKYRAYGAWIWHSYNAAGKG